MTDKITTNCKIFLNSCFYSSVSLSIQYNCLLKHSEFRRHLDGLRWRTTSHLKLVAYQMDGAWKWKFPIMFMTRHQLNGTRQSAKFTLHTYRPLENFGYYHRICCNMTHFILFSFSFRKFSLLIVMSFNFSCKNEMLAQDIQTSSKITFLFFYFYFYKAGTY